MGGKAIRGLILWTCKFWESFVFGWMFYCTERIPLQCYWVSQFNFLMYPVHATESRALTSVIRLQMQFTYINICGDQGRRTAMFSTSDWGNFKLKVLHFQILSQVLKGVCGCVFPMFENSICCELSSAGFLIDNSWTVSRLRLNELMRQWGFSSWRTTKFLHTQKGKNDIIA